MFILNNANKKERKLPHHQPQVPNADLAGRVKTLTAAQRPGETDTQALDRQARARNHDAALVFKRQTENQMA